MAENNPIERNANLCYKMKERISDIFKSLGGDKSRSIFDFSQTSHDDGFMPRVVSIGPYYRGNPRLEAMEAFKWECLAYSLSKSNKNLEDYLQKIWATAEECYSESSKLQTDGFLEMMVLDGFFVVEFIRFSNSVDMESHPLARMERANLQKICADLLMLQNQIPYKVFEGVFEVSKVDDESQSLPTLGLEFFSEILGSYYPSSRKPPEVEWMHLLDLVRSIFIPSDYEGWPSEATGKSVVIQMPLRHRYKPADTIPCVTKLRRLGVEVHPLRQGSLLVSFHRGVIWMPKIILNDLMRSFLENCVALEQRHDDRSKHFSVYALCLDTLVNSGSDVEYLCERRVIDNYLGTDEIAKFLNNLGKSMISFDWDYFDFFRLCNAINGYCQNPYRRCWTTFRWEYFEKPWQRFSGFVAFVLFVLTFLQTYYTICAYVYPKN